jgi:hypothetical protein
MGSRESGAEPEQNAKSCSASVPHSRCSPKARQGQNGMILQRVGHLLTWQMGAASTGLSAAGAGARRHAHEGLDESTGR